MNLHSNQLVNQVIEPVFRHMFSKMRHYPSVSLKYRPNVDLVTLQQKTPAQVLEVANILSQVKGSERYKYFSKPLVPYIAPLVVYDDGKLQPQAQKDHAEKTNEEPVQASRTIGIQTMFRESYAQTDPYTPQYILPPATPNGTQPLPEILTLTTFKFSLGLPVSTKELELIERARIKRQWEKTLPLGKDPASFEKRLRMMEEMELVEWKEREQEIAEVQTKRLQVFQSLLEKRKRENEDVEKERLEKVWIKKLQERDAMLFKLARKKEKELRRLEAKRDGVEKKKIANDIIDRYANISKKVGVLISRYHN